VAVQLCVRVPALHAWLLGDTLLYASDDKQGQFRFHGLLFLGGALLMTNQGELRESLLLGSDVLKRKHTLVPAVSSIDCWYAVVVLS
jgi:hypothetical protein